MKENINKLFAAGRITVDDLPKGRPVEFGGGETCCGAPLIGRKVLAESSTSVICLDYYLGVLPISNSIVIEKGLSGCPETVHKVYRSK